MKKFIESFKNNKSSLALIILALVLIITGISFALFYPSINLLGRRDIKISKCELDINFKESDELMLVSKYPISKDVALSYETKDITITNNSTCDTLYYKLTIKDLNNSSINKDKINYYFAKKVSYKLGDISGDGSIDLADSIYLTRYVANWTGYTLASKDMGDLNGDGTVDANDTTLLQNYISGSIQTFPVGTPLEEKTANISETTGSNPDTLVISNSLTKGKSSNYAIIMWIDESATNTDLYENGDVSTPYEYKYTLNIESSDEEISE